MIYRKGNMWQAVAGYRGFETGSTQNAGLDVGDTEVYIPQDEVYDFGIILRHIELWNIYVQ